MEWSALQASFVLDVPQNECIHIKTFRIEGDAIIEETARAPSPKNGALLSHADMEICDTQTIVHVTIFPQVCGKCLWPVIKIHDRVSCMAI